MLKVAPVFIESVSDLAVLGPLDRYAYDEEWVEAYESFIDGTKPVSLWGGRATAPFGIRIRSHKKTWITGTAENPRVDDPIIWIRTDERIEGRESGGPIVTDSGELVSVVTTAGGYLGMTNEGHAPLLRHALPAWIYRTICGTEP